MTCLFWLALNPLVRTKDKEFKALELLLAVAGTALFANAGLSCTDGNAMLTLFLLKQFSSLLIVPVALAYIRSLSADGEKKSYLQAFIAIPVSLLVAQIILLILTGPQVFMDNIRNASVSGTDKAEIMIRLCSCWIYYAILAIEIIAFIVIMAIKTAKEGRHIQIMNACAAATVYGILEISVLWPQWISAVISVVLACILFMLSYSGTFNGEIQADTVCKPERIPDPAPMKEADIHQSLSLADEDTLRIKFEDLIVSEQLFLKQGIRLADIAAMLDTNRTYVSRLVNNTYNMSFSDYINTLRIDYAEQYLLHHRDAKQSDIAAACGFPNAPAFNNVFKKITGVTPKIWLATKS
jgi:AraC-like DNA-binding protein